MFIEWDSVSIKQSMHYSKFQELIRSSNKAPLTNNTSEESAVPVYWLSDKSDS
jgi:hypothetical protein